MSIEWPLIKLIIDLYLICFNISSLFDSQIMIGQNEIKICNETLSGVVKDIEYLVSFFAEKRLYRYYKEK